MKLNLKKFFCITMSFILIFISILMAKGKDTKNLVQTSGNLELSNSKIEWGIKRGNNNQQPDLVSKNRKLIEKYNGMAMGNKESKNIYVTFDLGYEAGYTKRS